MIKILVVEDDKSLNQIVCNYLVNNGYLATACLDAESAMIKMDAIKFDLILSDIMMPGLDGFRFADAVRVIDKDIPIIFMSAKDDMPSKQKGYKIGVDDYLVKPVDLEELMLKIGAILKRAKIISAKKLEIGNLIMDKEEHTAYIDTEEILLTVREFDLLYKLLSYPKKTFTRSQLMDSLWDFDSSATSRTVDVYIAKIREKITNCTGFDIITVHGLGYKVVLK